MGPWVAADIRRRTFGRFTGHASLAHGKPIEIRDLAGVPEEHYARW